jgi:hypothetical protein
MNITFDELKELLDVRSITNCSGSDRQPFEIGKNYIVRTVTMIYTGKLVEVWPAELVLVEAAWIPETDRYMQFVEKGSVKECEPYPANRRVIIGRGSITDAVVLESGLPRSQK